MNRFQPTKYETSSSETHKYELTYVWLCYNSVFPENFLCKTCLRAVRECPLIRRHVDRQAGVFHSTASVVNSSRSVCERWAGPGLRMLCKHVESERYGPRETELRKALAFCLHTDKKCSVFLFPLHLSASSLKAAKISFK